ncbi:MAG TPA: hypothetical protein VL173_14210 [Vicinamibacterales bacterium]|jgi:hypothetical protein|nr:hypothetical protein [Vicinamibacterales bacterium]
MEPGHWIIITLIVAWAAAMIAGAWQSNQKELMKHRERLAMIEKGLPAPEEPVALAAPLQALMGTSRVSDPAEKERRMLDFIRFLGILSIGGGVGIFFLLTVLGEWHGAVGIGGLMVIVGVALIVTSIRALYARNGR